MCGVYACIYVHICKAAVTHWELHITIVEWVCLEAENSAIQLPLWSSSGSYPDEAPSKCSYNNNNKGAWVCLDARMGILVRVHTCMHNHVQVSVCQVCTTSTKHLPFSTHMPQELRCRNPTDPVVPNTRELLICQLCQHRQGGFNPGVRYPNKDACCLCSNYVFSPNGHPARICHMHAMKSRMNPSMTPCCVCRKPIFLADVRKNPSFGPAPAQLCQFCGFGIYAKSCCEFRDFAQ